MRQLPIANCRLRQPPVAALLAVCCLLTVFGLTCNGGDAVTPEPSPYDASRPIIGGFTAQRAGTAIEDGIVYGGEDITLDVQATSQAFPQSCGLSEGETVQGNLLYTFRSIPPEGVPAPGVLSQATPPSDEALWRVPNLSSYDQGDGLLYELQVTVFDECLSNQSTGSLTLRAFADQGPPQITQVLVQSEINEDEPITELLDQNGLYEIERGDECRITITAQSRTSPSICANRGVATGEQLEYIWASSVTDINLSFDSDPARASTADFDVPLSVPIGDTFQVECQVRDVCTDVVSVVTCRFIVVAAPRITSLEGTANGVPLTYNPFFDTYEVLAADEVILTALGQVMDDDLCDSKGIHPDLQWDWQELTGSTPAIAPEFEPLPSPNDTSVIEFVVPAAINGTEYEFQCTATDRCNDLTDVETRAFLVIVPPGASLTFVERDSTAISPSTLSGRFEVQADDVVTVRVTGSAASDVSFCEMRGVSQSPPLQYYWTNPWDALILNYEAFPSVEYCDVVFVVPSAAPPLQANIYCRVKDMCNELVSEILVPFEIVEG